MDGSAGQLQPHPGLQVVQVHACVRGLGAQLFVQREVVPAFQEHETEGDAQPRAEVRLRIARLPFRASLLSSVFST